MNVPAEPTAGICVLTGGPSQWAELPTRHTGPSQVLHTCLAVQTHHRHYIHILPSVTGNLTGTL